MIESSQPPNINLNLFFFLLRLWNSSAVPANKLFTNNSLVNNDVVIFNITILKKTNKLLL